MPFQISGQKENPYHLSVGAIVNDNNKYALIKKVNGIHTLIRETIYSNESLEKAIIRGIQEELGIEAQVIKYLGAQITYFDRPDIKNIEKTTIYFLTNKIKNSKTNKQQDEIEDTTIWYTKKECINILKIENNMEYKLFSKIK